VSSEIDERPSHSDPAVVARRFAPQLEICDELLRVIWTNRPAKGAQRGELKVVLQAILARSIETYDSVLALAREGRTLAALMLDRALFEDMVAAFWLCAPENRVRGLALIRDQEEHIVLLSNDSIRQYPHRVLVAADDYPDLDARRKEFEKQFGRYGTKSWFGDIHPALETMAPRWAELGGSVETLRVYYAMVQRHINLLMHNTVTSISRSLKRYDAAGSIDDFEIDVALRSASFSLYGLALLVFTELGIDVEELNALSPRIERVFLELDPRQRAAIGRNDPCWCGSGKKLKKCHGT
jgi:hypothetical protein